METGGLIAVGVFALLCILSVVTSIRFWLRLWGLSDQLNTLIEQNETANKQRKAANALLGEMVTAYRRDGAQRPTASDGKAPAGLRRCRCRGNVRATTAPPKGAAIALTVRRPLS